MTMTDERMTLLELVEQQADGDLVREMLAFAAERIMEAEVEARTGAAKGTRSPLAASVTTGRALRYAGGSARRLLHKALGHGPPFDVPCVICADRSLAML